MHSVSGILRVALLLVLLALSPLATAASAAPGPPEGGDSVALARDKTKDEGDKDRGHGNDPDGVDEDNPGRGNKKKDNPSAAPVEVTARYRVDVSCKAKGKDGGETSACEFRAVAPEGAEKATRVIVPADAVCADVVGGDYEQVEVRAGEGLNGYASKPDKEKFTLELDGDVATSGTMAYWIITGGGLLPAEGLALDCGDSGAAALSPAGSTPPPASTPAPETGTLAVVVATCADVPADTSGFDWFGRCQPGGNGEEHRLTAASGDGMQAWMATPDTEGTALFESLPPGEYRLETMGEPWCHAASDHVTAESTVVIEAGQRTSVYVFLCAEPTGS